MKPFELAGTWWSPVTRYFNFEAKLKYDPAQGARLQPTTDKFRGVFMNKYGQRHPDDPKLKERGRTYDRESELEPILVGVAEGRQFTLLHCQLRPFGGIVGLVIEGKHFDRVEDAIFPAYSISYSGLDEWGASGRLKSHIFQREDGMRDFQLSYEMPPPNEKPITIELEHVFVEISHSVSFFPEHIQGSITEKTEFRIIPKPNTTLSCIDMIDTYSNLLRNFLMLATWEFVAPLYLRGWNDASDIGKGQAEIYWRGRGMGLSIPEYKDNLFVLSDLGVGLYPVLQVWERNYKNYIPFIRNYFAHRYTPENYLETRFLAYIQALEGYHKKLKPDFQVGHTKNCHKKTRKPSLRERLVDLLKSLQNYSVVAKITDYNLNAFAQPLVDIRNRLTHEADLIRLPVELNSYTNKLELIILLLIYHSIGFSYDLIEQIAAENNGFQTKLNL